MLRLLSLFVLAAAAAGDAAATLAMRAKSQLPAGWTVERQDARVMVKRTAPVVDEVANSARAEQGEPRRFVFELDVGEVLTPDQRGARAGANEKVRKQIDTLLARHPAFACDAKEQAFAPEPCCFHPRTDTQQRVVDQCRQLEAKLQPVPDFHLASGESVELREVLDGDKKRWSDDPHCDDCAAVRSKLVGLLVPYTPISK